MSPYYYMCICFLAIEKLMNASTRRPETIATEINGTNSKIDSNIIIIIENADNYFFASNLSSKIRCKFI
jgi:hypothetical protein